MKRLFFFLLILVLSVSVSSAGNPSPSRHNHPDHQDTKNQGKKHGGSGGSALSLWGGNLTLNGGSGIITDSGCVIAVSFEALQWAGAVTVINGSTFQNLTSVQPINPISLGFSATGDITVLSGNNFTVATATGNLSFTAPPNAITLLANQPIILVPGTVITNSTLLYNPGSNQVLIQSASQPQQQTYGGISGSEIQINNN